MGNRSVYSLSIAFLTRVERPGSFFSQWTKREDPRRVFSPMPPASGQGFAFSFHLDRVAKERVDLLLIHCRGGEDTDLRFRGFFVRHPTHRSADREPELRKAEIKASTQLLDMKTVIHSTGDVRSHVHNHAVGSATGLARIDSLFKVRQHVLEIGTEVGFHLNPIQSQLRCCPSIRLHGNFTHGESFVIVVENDGKSTRVEC